MLPPPVCSHTQRSHPGDWRRVTNVFHSGIHVQLCSRLGRENTGCLKYRTKTNPKNRKKSVPPLSPLPSSPMTEPNQSRRWYHATSNGGAGKTVSHDRRNPMTHEQLGASTPAVSSAAQTSFSEIKPPKHTYACLRNCVRQWEG